MERLDADRAAAAFADAAREHAEVVAATEGMAAAVAEAADIVTVSVLSGGQVLLAGNGGSAADARHLAAELVGRYLRDRRPVPAIALCENASAVTAIGNDYGFEEVFARQVRAHGRAGDVLVAISTSGTSANVLRAAEAARERGMRVIALTGEGGALGGLADVTLAVPSAVTPRIQEAHILIGHVICGLVESALP